MNNKLNSHKYLSFQPLKKAILGLVVLGGLQACNAFASDHKPEFEVKVSAQKGGLIVNQARAQGMGYFGANPYYDLMLQSIFFVNNGDRPLTLTSGTIELYAEGKLLQSTPLSLEAVAHTRKMVKAFREIPNFAKVLFATSQGLPQGITLSVSPEIAKGTAEVVDDYYLLTRDLPDEVRVTAIAKNSEGEDVRAVQSVPVREHVSKNSYIFPLEADEWYINAAPDITSHHRWTGMTEFAMDIIKVDDRGSWSKGKADNWFKGVVNEWEDFYGYNKKVLAVADGEVVKVADDVEFPLSTWARQDGESHGDYARRINHLQTKLYATPGRDFARTGMGNHIVIKHANGEYSHYAHLAYGKIKVKLGQKVKQGDHIAGMGGTGEQPVVHLHFQMMDGMDLLNSATLPIQFNNIEVNQQGVGHHKTKAVYQGGYFVNNKN